MFDFIFDVFLKIKVLFLYWCNFRFAKIKNNTLQVRTYERGVEAETQACGTGMVASFLRAYFLNLISNSIKVYPISGEELTISYNKGVILFKGKVTKCSTGNIALW